MICDAVKLLKMTLKKRKNNFYTYFIKAVE